MTESYSKNLSELNLWKESLICVIMQFPSSDTTSIKKKHHAKIFIKHKIDHIRNLLWRVERNDFVGSGFELGNYAIFHQRCYKQITTKKNLKGFNQNINLPMAESYSEDMNKIHLWKMSLNFIVMQYLTRDATSIKNYIMVLLGYNRPHNYDYAKLQ